jgi:spore photoproduct lyase
MFASAHTVAFVNLDQYFEHTEAKLNELGDMYLCISYDSDLLAFEHFLGYVRKWIEFAQKHPTLTLEIRSKSANFKSINDLKPVNNVILAWTLSPEIISQKYEHKAPSLNARIKSMQEAVNSGWCVRLCLDPLILVPDWQDHYSELITRLASSIELSKLSNIYLGAFRLNNSHYLAIKNKRKKSALFNGNVNYIIKDQILSYSELEQESVKSFVTNKLITAGALDEQISWI